MYKIGTKYKTQNFEYEIISDDDLCYKVKWLSWSEELRTGNQSKKQLTEAITDGTWKIIYIPPKQKCKLCIR